MKPIPFLISMSIFMLPLLSCRQEDARNAPPNYACEQVSRDLEKRIESVSRLHDRSSLNFQEKDSDAIILTMEELAALREGAVRELYLNCEACKVVGGYLMLDCKSSLIVLIKGSHGVSELWQIWPLRNRIALYEEKDPLAPKPPFPFR